MAEPFAEASEFGERVGICPSDFPKEDYEAEWTNRFSVDQLNEIGARGLGVQRRTRATAKEATVD